MNEFKNYTRNPSQVMARRYELGDEDGFIVDRNNGKQMVVERDDKNYAKYTERCDYNAVAPYVYTPTGPLFVTPDSYIVVDMTTKEKTAMDAAAFEALHTEGEIEESRIITLN